MPTPSAPSQKSASTKASPSPFADGSTTSAKAASSSSPVSRRLRRHSGVVPKMLSRPKSSTPSRASPRNPASSSKARSAPISVPRGYELDVSNVQVVQRVPESTPYPSLPRARRRFFDGASHLWLRSQRQASILRVRAEIIRAARDFFDSNGFTLTDPPILTPAACEGTSTLFPVDYFEEQAYLTQSDSSISKRLRWLSQGLFVRPTFRAEKSKTRRHLTEFWMVEPKSRMHARRPDGIAEGLLTFLVKRCLERRRVDLTTIGRDLTKLEKIDAPFRASPMTKLWQSYRRAIPRACSRISSSGRRPRLAR